MSDGQKRKLPKVVRLDSSPRTPSAVNLNQQDGTTQLLRWGSTITAFGLVAIALLMTLLGGVGVEGAHSNSGWLALITGAMCLPFGLLLTLLGIAKWLRNRSIAARQGRAHSEAAKD